MNDYENAYHYSYFFFLSSLENRWLNSLFNVIIKARFFSGQIGFYRYWCYELEIKIFSLCYFFIVFLFYSTIFLHKLS
jgi:hypothetical protein